MILQSRRVWILNEWMEVQIEFSTESGKIEGIHPYGTKQACAFGDLYPQFREKGAVVLGVSKDSVASHKKFEEKYGLPFTLLSDPDKEVIQAYDVWKEKKNYGKVSMGVVRTTYLIDENGIIVKAFGKVKAADNPAQMLKELEPEA